MNQEFYHLGKNIMVASGEIAVKNPQKIYIGDNCVISQNVEMTVNDMSNEFLKYNLKFGDNSFINSSSKLEAKNYLEIGKHVTIGPYVYISDMEHEYEDFKSPIKEQSIKNNANKIIIKDGTWIGSGVKIVGNIKIGYGCVVGANSVVKSDVPDHCVVVGAPEKIIKICDYRTGQWIKIDGNTETLEQVLKRRGKFRGYKYYELQATKSKHGKKTNIKSSESESKINKNDLLEIYIIQFESLLNNLYEIVSKSYEDTIEVAFKSLIPLTEEIDNLLKEIIKVSTCKKSCEDFLVEFNQCLNSLIELYKRNDKRKFVEILDNELIKLMNDMKNQLDQIAGE